MKKKINEFLERAKQLDADYEKRCQRLSEEGILDLNPIYGVDYEQWLGEIKVLCKTKLSSHPLYDDLLAALKEKDISVICGHLQAINKSDISQYDSSPVKTCVANDNKSIFIIHGHDTAVQAESARFCEKIGLSPIILNEQPNKGKTLIEKFEEYSDVGFALVLYTPCDIGKENEDASAFQARARQNVVFEHGYLVAKLGRNRVCALVKGVVETPSDISGVAYIPIDPEGTWQYKVIDELKAAGYSVSKDSI